MKLNVQHLPSDYPPGTLSSEEMDIAIGNAIIETITNQEQKYGEERSSNE